MKTEILQTQVLELCRKLYPYGDNHYAKINRKTNEWELSYTNDNPMQHGDGENCVLSIAVVEKLIHFYDLKSFVVDFTEHYENGNINLTLFEKAKTLLT